MQQLLDLPLFAPIPVGHRVTVIALEAHHTPIGALLGGAQAGQWFAIPDVVVCDEDTRIVYADRSAGLHPQATYERISFSTPSRRMSLGQPPRRGRVVSCVVLTDHGERLFLQTLLGLERL
jgi:hypothetical protein